MPEIASEGSARERSVSRVPAARSSSRVCWTTDGIMQRGLAQAVFQRERLGLRDAGDGDRQHAALTSQHPRRAAAT